MKQRISLQRQAGEAADFAHHLAIFLSHPPATFSLSSFSFSSTSFPLSFAFPLSSPPCSRFPILLLSLHLFSFSHLHLPLPVRDGQPVVHWLQAPPCSQRWYECTPMQTYLKHYEMMCTCINSTLYLIHKHKLHWATRRSNAKSCTYL